MTEDTGHKLGIDWLKTIAGALAAVSSAVALSTLGAAGTIIGAALGSVIATVGGALYSQGLASSRKRLALAQAAALRKVGTAQAEVRRASRRQDDRAVEAHLTHADEQLGEAKEELDATADEQATLGWHDRFAALPWKRIALVAAGLFAATLLAITAFELVVGKPVSSMTGGTHSGGGTTLTHVGGGADHSSPPSPTVGPSPTPSSPSTLGTTPSSSPSTEPSPTGSPTGSPTASPTPSPSASATTPPPTPASPPPPASTPTTP